MSKTMKWILGIFIGLVVVAVVVGAGAMVFGRWGRQAYLGMGPNAQTWQQKQVKPGNENEPGNLPSNQNPNWRMPMQRFNRMPYMLHCGFFPLGMIFGALFSLGILTLIVLSIIALLKYIIQPRQPRAPAEPVARGVEIAAASETDVKKEEENNS
jgi:uncharacterized membrane protein